MANRLLAKSVVVPFGSITTSFTPVTQAGFTVYQMQIRNGTNQDVQISFDGINIAIFLFSSGGGGGDFFNIPIGVNVDILPNFLLKVQLHPQWDPSISNI